MTSTSSGPAKGRLLDIRDLHKNFGGVQAIHELDLVVNDSEIVGVIGPNGSGKTTLFNVITGIVDASRGTIRWCPEDVDISGKKPWPIFALGIARTFQNIRLSLGLSVLENVMMGLYLKTKTSWFDALAKTKVLEEREAMAREAAEDDPLHGRRAIPRRRQAGGGALLPRPPSGRDRTRHRFQAAVAVAGRADRWHEHG